MTEPRDAGPATDVPRRCWSCGGDLKVKPCGLPHVYVCVACGVLHPGPPGVPPWWVIAGSDPRDDRARRRFFGLGPPPASRSNRRRRPTATAWATLEREAREVAVAPEGHRVERLQLAVARLAGLRDAGQITKVTVTEILTIAARTAGLSPELAVFVIRSGLDGRTTEAG